MLSAERALFQARDLTTRALFTTRGALGDATSCSLARSLRLLRSYAKTGNDSSSFLQQVFIYHGYGHGGHGEQDPR